MVAGNEILIASDENPGRSWICMIKMCLQLLLEFVYSRIVASFPKKLPKLLPSLYTATPSLSILKDLNEENLAN